MAKQAKRQLAGSGEALPAGVAGELVSGLNSGSYTNYGTSGAMVDISGATVTLPAGTWVLYSEITALLSKSTADIIQIGYVRKSDNTTVDSWWLQRGESVAGSFGVTSSKATIVTISSSTTYKLSMSTTATVVSYASQGASIRAVRIA
jgi:hypothetical protein